MSTRREPRVWRCRDREVRLEEGRPLVMGIVNVTPDSFSDGGVHATAAAAVGHARRLLDDGADIIDIGGESTRPGASAVALDEELRRVVPVIEALAGTGGNALLSVDTMKAGVARAALAAGAHIINDVSAFGYDPDMVAVARETGAGVVLMHMRGTPRTMQDDPRYGDVVGEVGAYLANRIGDVVAGGVARACVLADPGIGFGKTLEHNLELLANLRRLCRLCGVPVVVGASRKRFLGALTGRPVDERLAGGLAVSVYGALNGAAVLRVHDVRETREALCVVAALAERRAMDEDDGTGDTAT